MEKRRTNRVKHRLTCEIILDRQSHPAVVRDLAPTGLFVETRQRPVPNSVVEVRFPAVAGLPAFSIEAGVARHRNVHPRLQTEIQSGIGLEILGRPPAYLELASRVVVPKLGGGGEAWRPDGAGAGEGLALRSYRVRLSAHGRSHPRTITVQATSLQAARARALTQAGAGWKITEVEAV
jgi:hypothetical protein